MDSTPRKFSLALSALIVAARDRGITNTEILRCLKGAVYMLIEDLDKETKESKTNGK